MPAMKLVNVFLWPFSGTDSLNSKLKSNWNYVKIEGTWKWKRDVIFFQSKYVIYLWSVLAVVLVYVFLWPRR